MPLFAIPFPAIDPVAIAVGPFVVRWYALAYLAGLLRGWRFCLILAAGPPRLVERREIDDFLVWATLGVVLGGRIGYVLFYQPGYYLQHPLEALYLWHGGVAVSARAARRQISLLLVPRAPPQADFRVLRHHRWGDPDWLVFRAHRQFHQRRA